MRKPIGGTHEPNSSLSPLAGSLRRRPGFQEDFRSGRQSGDAVGGGGSSAATASGAGLLSLPVIGWGGQSGRAALPGGQHHRHLDQDARADLDRKWGGNQPLPGCRRRRLIHGPPRTAGKLLGKSPRAPSRRRISGILERDHQLTALAALSDSSSGSRPLNLQVSDSPIYRFAFA